MHQGEFLRHEIAKTKMPIARFAAKVGVNKDTLNEWLKQKELKLRTHLAWAVAEALGVDKLAKTRAQLRAITAEPRTSWEIILFGAEAAETARGVDELFAKNKRNWPTTKEDDDGPGRIIRDHLSEIPLFELSLAAGPWSDVADLPEICGPDSLRQGLFRVRLAGDSMLQKYKSGVIVEFECLRCEMDSMEIGRDYYVQKNDGTATFKRVENATELELTLRALNRKKYPKAMIVERSTIVRMAVARGLFTPIE